MQWPLWTRIAVTVALSPARDVYVEVPHARHGFVTTSAGRSHPEAGPAEFNRGMGWVSWISRVEGTADWLSCTQKAFPLVFVVMVRLTNLRVHMCLTNSGLFEQMALLVSNDLAGMLEKLHH